MKLKKPYAKEAADSSTGIDAPTFLLRDSRSLTNFQKIAENT
jgi:hypothetical protein